MSKALVPSFATKHTLRMPMVLIIFLIHCVALAAPFTFSWPGFITFLILVPITACLGITLCYHRLLSHRSFKTHKWVQYFLMLCGTLSLEGDPTWWVATHRLHHKESDQENDPHSPQVSFLWSHILWLFFEDGRMADKTFMKRFAPELYNDPWAKFLQKHFLSVNIGFILLLTAAGYSYGGTTMALSMLVWGGAFRIVWVWHVTWFVNSVTHIYGYRNYQTTDTSKNIWWVALLAFGEGWHNNHHANPRAAKSGHKWWEFDFTYCIIKAMELTKLAWKLHPVVALDARKFVNSSDKDKVIPLKVKQAGLGL
ncbi:MAG: fatty acid desaturase [Cyanobacteria bacterium P01_H01_bin.74]